MRALLLTVLLCFTRPFTASSQTYFPEPIKEDLLKGRVKQVEEFLARFNYEEDWQGKKVTDSTDPFLRSKYIHTLFDYARFRQKDGKLTPVAEEFIQEVVKHRYLIHYTDTSWSAKVKCKAVANKKRSDIVLYLHTRQIAPHEYAWVVTRAESLLLKSPADSLPYLKISPVEHEIGFTGLLSLKNIGKLKITQIEDVSFHFRNVPGYSFTIERIERKNSYNTGWLITSLNKL